MNNPIENQISLTTTRRMNREEWSKFWEKGTLTAFEGQFDNNYDGPIAEFWQHIFNLLPSHSHLVDFATGNGALALLAAQLSDKPITITALDTATIYPPTKGPFSEFTEQVAFKANTDMAATGLETHSIDCVVSQFGIEYGDSEPCLAELNRILKPAQASFAAIIHHTSSDILEYAKESVEQISLCSNSGLIDVSRKLLSALHQSKTNNTHLQKNTALDKLRKHYGDTFQNLERTASKYEDTGHFDFLLQNVKTIFHPSQLGNASLDTQMEVLDFIENESNAFNARMLDLLGTAMDSTDIAELTKSLKSFGFAIDQCDELFYNGKLFGWQLCARR